MTRSSICAITRHLGVAAFLLALVIANAQPAFAQSDCATALATAQAEGRYRGGNTLPAGNVGTVVAAIGEVTVTGCGRRAGGEPLVQDGLVHIGDIIETGERGRARIEFDNRDDRARTGPSVMNIGPKSRARVELYDHDETRTKSTVELFFGAIRYFFKGAGGRTDTYTVRAGVAICGIQGSDALIAHGPGSTTPLVAMLNEGHMTVRSGGRSVDLSPGEAVSTEKDGSISAPERFEPVVWDAAIAVFIDGDIGGFDFDIHLNGEPPT